MAYSKQNFQNGQILNAANLEAMENGIIAGQGAHNLLDNSDFTNPVNQRGKTSYSGGEYAIDRWKMQSGTNMTLMDGFIRITGEWDTQQILGNKLIGTYTYAICAKINVAGEYTQTIEIYENGSSIATSFCTAVGEWKIYTCTATFTGGTNPVVTINNRAGSVSDASIDVKWAALYEGSYTADTLPAYVPKGKHVEMLNCNVPLAPHNLLDNSDFRNPVNQRGQSSYSGITYTIDRWRSWDSNNITTVNDGNISVSTHIIQNIPKNRFKNGSAYTIALCASDGTIYVNSGVYTPDAEDFGDWTHIWVEITDSGDVAIYIRNGTYIWAALYEGSYDASTLPAYQPKGYAAELAECRRYYQQYNTNGMSAVGNSESGITYIRCPLQVPMRTAPSLVQSSVEMWTTYSGTTNKTEVFTFYNSSPQCVHLKCTSGTGSAYQLVIATNNAAMAFSADL